MLALLGRSGLWRGARATPKAALTDLTALSTRNYSFRDDRILVQTKSAWKTQVVPALRTYLEIHGHLLMPISFVVPHREEHWPPETWDYPLGKHAALLRSIWRKNSASLPEYVLSDLHELHFPWDKSQYKWGHIVLPAIKRFYELYGHADVPKHFVVPEGDSQWSSVLWGMRLGITVHNVRNRNDFAKHVAATSKILDDMDFCYGSTMAAYNWRERILPSLVVFRQQYGHCDVGTLFVVPPESPWPERAWGIRLGSIVNNMRSRNDYAVQVNADKARLEALGFVWQHSAAEWHHRVVPALATFQDLHGHCKVPCAFVVPADESWAEVLWGYKLGAVMRSIRYRNSYFDFIARDLEQLTSMGLEWRIWSHKWEERIEPLLSTFEELYGHRDIPQDFVVPSEEPWDEKSWDYQLGRMVMTEVITKAAPEDEDSPELNA